MEIAEHCVGFPTAEELDGVLVDVGAEESCGATRSKAACADEFWGHASGCFEAFSRLPECIGDVMGFDGSLSAVVGVICADWCVVRDRAMTDVHDRADRLDTRKWNGLHRCRSCRWRDRRR